MLERILRDAVTFFVVICPFVVVPVFIGVTREEPLSGRRRIALRAVGIAAVILIASVVVGEILLKALGVTLPSFRIAGGLVLLVISLKIILEENRAAEPTAMGGGDVAVFPLAMPLIAGPGTIMAAVLLTDNDRFSVPEQMVTCAVLLAVLALTYAMLVAAEAIHRLLGTTGANVMNRVMGLILAALSVETILAGIRGAILTFPH